MKLMEILALIKNVLIMITPQLKQAESTKGIKETKEALNGALELGLVLAERLKDGVGVDDLGALWDRWRDDPALKETLKAAVDGYAQIDDEIKDVDAGEGVELLCEVVDYVPRYMDALKKPKAQ